MSEKFTTLLAVDDETIENLAPKKHELALAYVHEHLTEKGCPELRGTELWNRVFKRAFLIMIRRAHLTAHAANLQWAPIKPAIVERAAIVADDHCRQWGVDEAMKDDRWPTVPALMEKWGIDVYQLLSCRQQAMISKWEDKYIPRESKATMTARLERAAMQDVSESRTAAIKDRPAVLRTAADIIGLTKKKTEIHVGPQVVVQSSADEAKWLERARRLMRYLPKEDVHALEEARVEEGPRAQEGSPREATRPEAPRGTEGRRRAEEPRDLPQAGSVT